MTECAVHQETVPGALTEENFYNAIESNFGYLLGVAKNYSYKVGVEPLEIVHGATIKVLTRVKSTDQEPLPQLHPDSALKYLTRAVGNHGIDQLRASAKRGKPISLESEMFDQCAQIEPSSRDSDIADQVAGSLVVSEALKYLYAYNPTFGEVFEAIIVHDQSNESYAKQTGMNPQTVKSKLFRAKEVLRAAYQSGELTYPL